MLGLRPVALLPVVTAFGLQALAVTTLLGGCATTPLSPAAGVGGPSASETTGTTQHVQRVRSLRLFSDDPAQPLGPHHAAWPDTPDQPSAADADAIIAAAITAHEMRKP
jgi:hypothetical protein